MEAVKLFCSDLESFLNNYESQHAYMLLLSGSTFLHVCMLLIGAQLVRLNSGLEIASAGTHTYTYVIQSCLDFGSLSEP